MTKITESEIEKHAIELLEEQDYRYNYTTYIPSNIHKVSGPLGSIKRRAI